MLDDKILIMKIRNFQKLKYWFSSAKQWVEPEQAVSQKVKILANLIKTSKYPIFFTGAGCSTSIGIPDYRSGLNTVVSTGPGIWNRDTSDKPPKLRIDQIVDKAVPSLTHMGIKTLLQKNIFKYLVSQNTDGLHLRSGVKSNKISELHGNRNLQKCVECKREYFRDFRTIKRGTTSEQRRMHLTGRKCENCGGDLIDSIIYFGEKLPKMALSQAFQQAATCDLLVAIGSSLTVRPSSNVPLLALKNNAKLCIINIQQTPFDQSSYLKINGFCDTVMQKLTQELKIQIQAYQIQHYLQLQLKDSNVYVIGKDGIGNNFSYIRCVEYQGVEYQPVGNRVKIEYRADGHEIMLHFYEDKSSINIHLPSHYKLFHGQPVLLKLTKKQQQQWNIQQI